MLSIEQQLDQHPAVFCKRLQCLQCKQQKKQRFLLIAQTLDQYYRHGGWGSCASVWCWCWLGRGCLLPLFCCGWRHMKTTSHMVATLLPSSDSQPNCDIAPDSLLSIILQLCKYQIAKFSSPWNRNAPLHLQVLWAFKPDHQLKMFNILAQKKKKHVAGSVNSHFIVA